MLGLALDWSIDIRCLKESSFIRFCIENHRANAGYMRFLRGLFVCKDAKIFSGKFSKGFSSSTYFKCSSSWIRAALALFPAYMENVCHPNFCLNIWQNLIVFGYIPILPQAVSHFPAMPCPFFILDGRTLTYTALTFPSSIHSFFNIQPKNFWNVGFRRAFNTKEEYFA